MAQLHIDFEWWRDAKGYRLVVGEPPKQPKQIKWGETTAISAGQDAFANSIIMLATGDILQTASVILPETLLRTNAERLGHRIVRSGGDLIPYRPLSDFDGLFRLFANAAPTTEGMLDFIDKFGPLTRDGLDEERGEHVSDLIEQAEAMSKILDLYSSGRNAGLVEILRNDRITLTKIETALISDPATRTLRLQLSVVDLLAGMWVQLGQTLSSGATMRRCEQCGMLFEAGPGTGRRLDAKFCSDDHRIAFNSQKRTKRS